MPSAEQGDRSDDAALAALNADVEALDRLLVAQHYRLAHWRSASRDLGYRRFFDINSLIGLRVELEEVFEATHRLVLERVVAGQIQGLRIDHVDGLRDPQAYLKRLRAAAPEAWIVVEKILEPGERLPASWPVDGTTGYEFAALVNRLLADPGGIPRLDAAWRTLAPQLADWEEVAHAARLDAIAGGLGSDLNRLTERLLAICEAHRRYRDFTRHELHEALRELMAAMDVYRTYVAPGRVSDADRAVIGRAERRATERRPDVDPDLFAFIGGIGRLEVGGPDGLELAMRLQQLTPAAMAKGIEDTALYRYLRLTAVNEVGADPSALGLTTDAFHAAMQAVAKEHPATMQATSTHDTKRSEDVRARILQLTGAAERYEEVATGLRRRLAAHWPAGVAPDPALAELLVQTLVGAWPIDRERLTAYLRKAAREAKLRTSWAEPDSAYESAIAALVDRALADPEVTRPTTELVGELLPAARAASLAQVLLRLTVPGVPDTYQGTELWDGSLVDPDNRRPVDFDQRAALLDAAAEPPDWGDLARDDAGANKAWLIWRALAVRRRHSDAFGPGGTYRPLPASGPAADGLVAFLRGEAVVTTVARWPLRAVHGWEGTSLPLPAGHWRDVLGGGEADGGRVGVARLLERLPVALLERVT